MDWSFGPVLNMTRTGSDGSLGLHTPTNGSPLVYRDSHKVASLDSVPRAVHLAGTSATWLLQLPGTRMPQRHVPCAHCCAPAYQRLGVAGREGPLCPQRALSFEPGGQASRLGPGLAALQQPVPELHRLSQPSSRTASPVASVRTGANSSFDSPFSSLEASSRPGGASIWGAPALGGHAGQGTQGQQQIAHEMVNTYGLACPLTKQVMRDPVVAGDGYTYERSAIEHWLGQHTISPITKQPLPDSSDLVPNLTMRSAIQLLIPQH